MTLTAADIRFVSDFDPPSDRGSFERLPGGGYVYSLIDDRVRIELRYLRREHGALHAEADVQCTWAGACHHKGSLSCADLNVSSQAARKSLAKHCAERSKTSGNEFDWMGAIDGACLELIRAERQSDGAIVLDDAPEIAERNINVFGLQVPADAASMLIAHGDSLKSMILLLVLGTLAHRGHKVLYLDWECSADRHRARKRRLFGDDRLESLRYMRCRAPLVQILDPLRRYSDEQRITFIGVDSVGLACDGKLIDDDVAIRFHRALAMLPPAMCAAHVPKSAIGPDGKGDAIGPFGSVFFSNLCRASWLVKKQPDANDNIVTVGLFRQKQNDGDRCPPVGLEFTFEGAARICVRPVDIATVEGLAQQLPLSVRMKALLSRGPMTFDEIAEALGAKVDSVIKAANRRHGDFTRVPGPGVTRLALVERLHA
jgi:hypothetical protein